MNPKTNLDCFRGDSKTWRVTISRDGVLVDLTGAKLWMTGMTRAGGTRVFQRSSATGGGIVIDPDQTVNRGQALIKLAPDSTAALPSEVTTLYYDIQTRTADGDISTDMYGDLVVSPDATTETA